MNRETILIAAIGISITATIGLMILTSMQCYDAGGEVLRSTFWLRCAK